MQCCWIFRQLNPFFYGSFCYVFNGLKWSSNGSVSSTTYDKHYTTDSSHHPINHPVIQCLPVTMCHFFHFLVFNINVRRDLGGKSKRDQLRLIEKSVLICVISLYVHSFWTQLSQMLSTKSSIKLLLNNICSCLTSWYSWRPSSPSIGVPKNSWFLTSNCSQFVGGICVLSIVSSDSLRLRVLPSSGS